MAGSPNLPSLLPKLKDRIHRSNHLRVPYIKLTLIYNLKYRQQEYMSINNVLLSCFQSPSQFPGRGGGDLSSRWLERDHNQYYMLPSEFILA